MPDAFPKLRDDIDAAPASRDGEVFYIIYDRAGIAPARLILSPLALLVASRLDGQTSILDIADRLSGEAGGEPLGCHEVEKIVSALGEALFLDDAAFHDYRSQADRDFRAVASRPASSAGSAYPDDPERLASELGRMMAEAPPPEEQPGRGGLYPAGVVAPHIDFMRGAHGYGQVYGCLREKRPPGTVIVIGTAHLPIAEPFALCDKDFCTPLGDVPADREVADRIRRELEPYCDIDRDVLSHRGEHSVELQAVWLRYLYGDRVRIVPLLANSLGEFIEGGRDPAEARNVPAMRAMASCLAELVEEGGIMLMASADLAHVGPRFGDQRELNSQFLAEVETADRDYLAEASSDPVAGLRSLAAHGDRYHVCGSAPIFLVGLALEGRSGRLLGYHQALTPEMRQAVTYASMVFE